ncbi:hypothetical protein, partial [Flavobacterium sp. LB1P71]|uniref:hypothetical protein n=1 Tax=Flavobacterium sp. LB1P71 TaxID=3401716 RepID=UPI003AAF1BF5
EKGAVVLSTPTGGTGNITFGSTATTNLAAGNYTYTATDANGCSVQKSVTINAAPTEISFTATATQPKCFGEKGAVVLSTPTGGTGNITFGSTATTNLAAGDYTYTATDANGCSVEKSVTINAAPTEISFTATATQPKCFGEKGAVVLSTPTGGTGNITFGSTATTNLAAGDYTYTATDANGCSVQKSVTINAAPTEISFTATATQPKCFGEKGAVVLSTPTGGTGNITFGSTATTNLAAGDYTYTATDANGCSVQKSVTINAAPTEISFTATATQPKCFGEKGAVVLSTPTGGTGNITFGSTATTNLAAGDYTYTATDANGCSVEKSVTINAAPTEIILTATATKINCFGGTGSVTLVSTGGSGTYTYKSSNPATSGLIAGTYTYSVTDANNCTATATVTLIDGDAIPPVISQLPEITTIQCPNLPLFATATAIDNINSNVSLTSTDITTPGTCTGKYSITRTWTATDTCGNSSTASQTINVTDTTAPTFTTPQNITLNSGENCITNINPTITGNITNINDTCDSNPTVTYIDTECFGVTETNGSINAGNGNYFPFTVSGFDDLSASNIQKIALSFETNQGKGRAEFTLVSPSGQGVILVGPYCSGGNCDDANSNTKELYSTTFYPNSSGYTQWNNANFIPDGIHQNMTPNGGITSPNTITGLTSYASSFENLTGPMNGTWFIYSRKQASVNGSIDFNSVCLTPTSSCTSNKVISRTWTVTDACGNFSKAIQTIKIQDTTAPTASNPAAITLDGCNGTFPAADITVVTNEADACSTPVVAFVGDSAPAVVGCTE